MANVTINDNTKYVELRTLCEGDYFILSGELYIMADDSFCGYCVCFNLSNNEDRRELDNETKVIYISSDKVKIKVEI